MPSWFSAIFPYGISEKRYPMTSARLLPPTDAEAFFKAHPQIERVEAFMVDVNGTLRGKWLPVQTAAKIFSDGLRLPFSIHAVDIWGRDVLAAGLVNETGDTDGIVRAVAGRLHVMPWEKTPAAQVLMTTFNPDGTPFFADPRHVLSRVLDFYAREGLTPVVAVELEFYLTDEKRDEQGRPQPPLSPRTGRRADASQMYNMDDMAEFSGVLEDIRRACAAQGLPADTVISENGIGQYEINLLHVADALAAADHAILLKRVIKGVARQHGMAATFMAKPYAGQSGNGMHVHFSVLDANGKNIFAAADDKGTDLLRHALAGLMTVMPESTAIFAPNANAYRRFRAGSHAPTRIAWGYDNRTASLRIPQSAPAATRIEHRVSGADANPYLVLAVILAGALYGISGRMDAGPPASGNVYETAARRLPDNWEDALALFENSGFAAHYLGEDYRRLYAVCKRQEKEELESQITSAEYDAYLRNA